MNKKMARILDRYDEILFSGGKVDEEELLKGCTLEEKETLRSFFQVRNMLVEAAREAPESEFLEQDAEELQEKILQRFRERRSEIVKGAKNSTKILKNKVGEVVSIIIDAIQFPLMAQPAVAPSFRGAAVRGEIPERGRFVSHSAELQRWGYEKEFRVHYRLSVHTPNRCIVKVRVITKQGTKSDPIKVFLSAKSKSLGSQKPVAGIAEFSEIDVKFLEQLSVEFRRAQGSDRP